MVMVAVQLGWRVLFSENNVVQAFPEFIATAIARLTPIEFFGTVTETYGSLAKRSLLVACVIGIVAIGPIAGQRALMFTGKSFPSLGRRLFAGLTVAAALLLIVMLVILPIANLGMFASDSSYQSDILLQLTVTFALWAVLWAFLSHDGRNEETAAVGEPVSRRYVVSSAAWSVIAIGAIGTTVLSLVDMFRVPKLTEEERLAQEATVEDIVSEQRAEQAASPSANNAASPAPEINQFAQLESEGKLTSVLTPNGDFYHVSKNFTDPTVSAEGWTLEISGLVDTPLTFTHDQLMARATTRQISTLCCISNELNGDLIGTAEWTGIPLVELLNEAGVQTGAIDLKFSAADDYTDSVPVAVGQDPHVLLVVGMNGVTLPDDHGFPARLILPPIYGMKNLKWLQKIEAVDEDYIGYWQERGWSDSARYQIWGRIDSPDGGKIPPGQTEAAGVASAGDRGVQRVEISLDDGATWADATLEPGINAPLTWVRWVFPFEAVEGKMVMRMRVTDGLGEVMLEEVNAPLPDGATGWPKRTVTVGA
jgi:DMSO/TMAO reductase YedYZ molybdopterin-dependent catalytic subunit